jgi:hypothetical protein
VCIADGKVRLLEVSIYAKGPRKGDVCPDVAFHEEMPKIPLNRYTWNNTPPSLRSWAMEQENPPNIVDQYTRGGKKKKTAENPERKVIIPRRISKQS